MGNRGIILMMFLSMFLLTGCSSSLVDHDQRIEKGILDISEGSLDDHLVKLKGEWNFYWNQFYDPHQTDQENADGYIYMPGSWNQFKLNEQAIGGRGYGTYQISLISDKEQRVGIYLPRIFTSYQLWVNQEKIAYAGQIGTHINDTIPQYLPQIRFFHINEGNNDVKIYVSNFHHRSGGVLEDILLGSEEDILQYQQKNIIIQTFLFGSLLIVGLYHLVFYLFRKKNRSLLYFGFFCVLVALRTVMIGERIYLFLMPNISYEIAHNLQTLSYYLGLPIIMMFFQSVFPKDFHRNIVRFVQIFTLSFTLLVLLTPARIFTPFNPLYQIFTLLVMGYIFFIFVKRLIHKKSHATLMFVGILILMVTTFNDLIFLNVWMNDHHQNGLSEFIRMGGLSSVGQVCFALINSAVLANTFSQALDKEEKTAHQLKDMNTRLDQLVHQRTKALKQSNQKIHEQKKLLEEKNQRLEKLSLKDSLTGLWNRRHYAYILKKEWNICKRFQKPLSLLMIDIDDFKKYNDCYGHQAGDVCLERIGKLIDDHFQRANDLAVRYGGEEFVVLLSNTKQKEAEEAAEKLRVSIEKLIICHDHTYLSSGITISIGVATIIPDQKRQPQELFVQADKALYIAKANGKNQVVLI